MFYLTIVNKVLRNCHSWLARQYVYCILQILRVLCVIKMVRKIFVIGLVIYCVSQTTVSMRLSMFYGKLLYGLCVCYPPPPPIPLDGDPATLIMAMKDFLSNDSKSPRKRRQPHDLGT